MPSTRLLLDTIASDYPSLTLRESSEFRWSPGAQTLYFDGASPNMTSYILHELGHALLGHNDYARDIDLIKIERDAWDYAQSHLAGKYGVVIAESLIQGNLDTYREWLHARSKCPSCGVTGLQSSRRHYTCLGCGCRWKNNEARSCALRRYTIAK